MKVTGAVTAVMLAAVLTCWCDGAQAFRPFDGTDAAVADTGEVEIELGPAEYLQQGSERELFAPNLRINYGFTPDWEATIEGELAHTLAGDVPETSLVGNIASLKTVLRQGSLQEKPGPSIATEFDVLLPGIGDEHGTGVNIIGIVSQQLSWATVHVNAAAALTQEQQRGVEGRWRAVLARIRAGFWGDRHDRYLLVFIVAIILFYNIVVLLSSLFASSGLPAVSSTSLSRRKRTLVSAKWAANPSNIITVPPKPPISV
jgi:hypothetical protein